MTVNNIFETATTIATADVEPTSRRGRAAYTLSRSIAAEGHALVIREAALAFIGDCYELDARDHWVNIDPHTYRVLIPTPWGRLGRKQWGVPWLEAEVLKTLMHHAKSGPITYDMNSWFVAIHAYPTLPDALAWVNRAKFDADTWLRGYEWWQRSQPKWRRKHANAINNG